MNGYTDVDDHFLLNVVITQVSLDDDNVVDEGSRSQKTYGGRKVIVNVTFLNFFSTRSEWVNQ